MTNAPGFADALLVRLQTVQALAWVTGLAAFADSEPRAGFARVWRYHLHVHLDASARR